MVPRALAAEATLLEAAATAAEQVRAADEEAAAAEEDVLLRACAAERATRRVREKKVFTAPRSTRLKKVGFLADPTRYHLS